MATVTAFIRKTQNSLAKIRFRLRDGRDLQLFYVSDILVEPDLWDNKKQEIKSRVLISKEKRLSINTKVSNIKQIILDVYSESSQTLTSETLTELVNVTLYPHLRKEENPKSLNLLFQSFINQKAPHISELRVGKYESILRILKRYQLYNNIELNVDCVSTETIASIEQYMRDEYLVFKKRPDLFTEVKDTRVNAPRGKNTIIDRMQAISTFFKWCEANQHIQWNPFSKYKIETQVYGTPYYISIEERNKLYTTNLSRHPFYARMRDIFVFQCVIGCRISDLYSFTKRNLIDNCIQYVPRKTKDKTPKTVKVPLNSIAQEILDRYADPDREALLPYASEFQYNKAIKKTFLAAGLTRPVVVIDPVTREQVIKPLNEIASSHLARRTFVGNLYKKVQDPSLISALSGHEEGSRAFLRYRNIDDELKEQLVKLLEK